MALSQDLLLFYLQEHETFWNPAFAFPSGGDKIIPQH